MKAHPVLLLTGKPGIGKTTVIKRLVGRLSGLAVSGFYTEEIRLGKHRVGFRLIGLGGPSGVIAHIDFDTPQRVGRYKVDVAAVDRLAAANLMPDDTQLSLIDEIGKMECLSKVFENRVRQRMDSDRPVVATVAQKGGGFIEAVKHLPGCVLWEVTRENRDRVVDEAIAWLRQRGILPCTPSPP